MDWKELGQRVNFIRDLYKKSKITIKPDGGLARALDEASALAAGEKLQGEPSAEQLRAIAHDAHVVWSLATGLEACVDAGLDVTEHLKCITTGSTDFGNSGDGKVIFYKDFECELFIAATLLGQGVPAKFSAIPNDPRGDIVAPPIRVEVKHPNSAKQLQKLLRKFNGKLKNEGIYGVFVVGIEDMFNLAQHDCGDSLMDFDEWLDAKRDDIEVFGREFLSGAATYTRVLAVAQTQTLVEPVGEDGNTVLRRLGNSCFFDDRIGVPDDALMMAKRVAQAFNPKPRIWTEIKDLVQGTSTEADAADASSKNGDSA